MGAANRKPAAMAAFELGSQAERQRILSLLDSEEMVGPAIAVGAAAMDEAENTPCLNPPNTYLAEVAIRAALQSIREELAKS